MSGCHVPSMSGFEDDQRERIKFCIACNEKLDKYKCIWAAVRELQNNDRINKLESHIEKLHDMINMEDRITALDVLNRLTKLENAHLANFEEAKEIIFAGAQTHASILRCEAKLKELDEIVKRTTENNISRKPHKCPLCDGQGGFYISGTMDSECNACKTTGIVWG